MKKLSKNSDGITLIALVITIIVLLILAGVTILVLTGNNSILNKTNTASEETRKQTAAEILNLKITNTQMETYTKEQRMPSLKELAISLDPENDKDIQSISKNKTKVSSLDWIDDTDYSSIFTILKDYPEYEFEINSSLQLASINDIPLASEGYIKPEGTKTITENGTNIDVKQYEFVDVNVPTYEVLETGSYSLANTNSISYCECTIPLKNTYSQSQKAHFLVTSITNAPYDMAWYMRATTLNTNIVGNTFSTVFFNYASVNQSGTVNYAIVGIANP